MPDQLRLYSAGPYSQRWDSEPAADGSYYQVSKGNARYDYWSWVAYFWDGAQWIDLNEPTALIDGVRKRNPDFGSRKTANRMAREHYAARQQVAASA